jgi:hypothetical protein
VTTVARCFFALTACSALVGVALEFWVACHNGSVLPPRPGTGLTRSFGPCLEAALNQPFFFTTQSNTVVGVTTLLLALRLNRRSDIFHMFRVAGLIDILITFIVFHLLLAGNLEPTGAARVANLIQHTVNPVLAVLGWALFGPAGSVTVRRTLLAAIVPAAYLAVTLVRGAIVHWYPYPILDVRTLGYAGVAVHVLAIVVLFLLVAGALAVVDPRRTGAAGAELGAGRSRR